MIVQTIIRRLPGKRIEGYRNSSPRFVKVLAVGPHARKIIADVNEEERGNVLASGEVDPRHPGPMDQPVDGHKPHAVVVVHQRGDDDDFPFVIEPTAAMLSFIVLEAEGAVGEQTDNEKVRSIRAIADLFVTTTDREFVKELVGNLSS
jgi:hypothetical protein